VAPVIAVAAGVGLSAWPRAARLLNWPLITVTAVWSAMLYFSPDFWTREAVPVYSYRQAVGRVHP